MTTRTNDKLQPSTLQLLAVCFAVAYIVGCGAGDSGLVPVEGTVTLDNKPLADATVSMLPVRATSPGPFTGTTDTNGRFALGPVGSEAKGAAVGEYFLVITTVDRHLGDEFTPPPTQQEIVPAEYSSGTKRFEVPEGGNKQANFAMTR